MSLEINKEFKKNLYESLLLSLDQKIEALSEKKRSLENDKSGETKSVVGDKYETSRSMIQMEEDQIAARLKNVLLQRTRLLSFKKEVSNEIVEFGSVIKTNRGVYCIIIPIGKVIIDGHKIFCMSIDAPLSKKLLGLKVGNNFEFQSKNYLVEQIV